MVESIRWRSISGLDAFGVDAIGERILLGDLICLSMSCANHTFPIYSSVRESMCSGSVSFTVNALSGGPTEIVGLIGTAVAVFDRHWMRTVVGSDLLVCGMMIVILGLCILYPSPLSS